MIPAERSFIGTSLGTTRRVTVFAGGTSAVVLLALQGGFAGGWGYVAFRRITR